MKTQTDVQQRSNNHLAASASFLHFSLMKSLRREFKRNVKYNKWMRQQQVIKQLNTLLSLYFRLLFFLDCCFCCFKFPSSLLLLVVVVADGLILASFFVFVLAGFIPYSMSIILFILLLLFIHFFFFVFRLVFFIWRPALHFGRGPNRVTLSNNSSSHQQFELMISIYRIIHTTG